MTRRARILVVDDHAEMARLLVEELAEAGHEVLEATGGAQAIEVARTEQPDVVVTDLRMSGVDGFDVLQAIHDQDASIPILIMTAFGSIDTAVDAMRRGAFTYLTKPFRTAELLVQVDKALAVRALADENRSLRRRIADNAPVGMIGHSEPMRAVYRLIARLADADVPVLIRGESGTGKERVAQALHAAGARATRSFVAVNCASIAASLLESELFGHAKGSFTGAATARRGLFVEADGGTLFLDEIGDMALELQAHLLRVVEDGVIRAVGADTGRRVDVRLVVATHQDLEARVADGRFRADLFYRLNVVPIVLPPLRERVDDIAELFAAFAARTANPQRLSAGAFEALEHYPWPGNVRELENLVRRLGLLVDHPLVTEADLRGVAPNLFGPRSLSPLDVARRDQPTLAELERDYIAAVIQACGGNKTRAAEILGIDVSTIHRRARGS